MILKDWIWKGHKMEKCIHEWKVVSKEILPSAYEQMKDDTLTSMESKSILVFQKSVVIIVGCSKCGKLDKTIVKNPE